MRLCDACRPPGAAQLAPPPTPLTTSRAWNAAERIALWPAAPPNGTFVPATLPADWPAPFVANVASPELRVFPAQQPNGHAVLVIPGGGYQFVSVENEGADFAARLNARGYTVFVLVYRLPSEGWQRGEDVPLQDAQRAMRVIRANAARWKIRCARPGRRGLLRGRASRGDVVDQLRRAGLRAGRWRGCGECQAIRGSAHLSGRHDDGARYAPDVARAAAWPESPASQVARRSAELHVGAETPPLLLVHAIDDTAVPVSNSLNLLTAMRAADRPVEAHLFQEGGHAFASGYPNSPTSSWIAVFDAWLARLRASP